MNLQLQLLARHVAFLGDLLKLKQVFYMNETTLNKQGMYYI